MKDLLIFPYSGTGIEALDCLGEEWNCIGFISDDKSSVGNSFCGVEIFDRSAFEKFPEAKVLAIHGSPLSFKMRPKIMAELNLEERRYARVIHPKASIGKKVTLGKNVLIMAGVVITANANIGNHVVVLPNTVIHHDAVIKDFTLIAANCTLAGSVVIAANCYIGASSSIKNGVSLNERTLVGIGANVILTAEEPEIVLVGNPAKRMKQ